jgi:2-methylcitrate dehydratase
MVAVPLIKGSLTAEDYEDESAADPRLDWLRSKIEVKENEVFSRDYLDPDKRSIANAIQVFFTDGSSTGRVEVAYPIGHRRRREEGIPLLLEKFKRNIATILSPRQQKQILDLSDDQTRLEETPVNEFMEKWVVCSHKSSQRMK